MDFKNTIKIFIISILSLGIWNLSIDSSSATVEAIDHFNLNDSGSVYAHYDADKNELQIKGHGQFDRDKWRKMAKKINSKNGPPYYKIWKKTENFDIRFISDDGTGPNKIEFPEKSYYIFAYFDKQVYLGNNDIDTSKTTNLRNLFYKAKEFNQPITELDLSKIDISGAGMFVGAESFNQPIPSEFNKMTSMENLFYEAKSFNKPFSWEGTKLISVSRCFFGAENVSDIKIIAPRGNKADADNWLDGPKDNLERLEFRGIESSTLSSFKTNYAVWIIDDDTGEKTLVPNSFRRKDESFTFEDSHHYLVKEPRIIEYKDNGATSGTVPNKQVGIENDDETISDNTGNLEKTGSLFLGWNTQADGKGVTYKPSDNYTFGDSLVLYAKWGNNIVYNGNDETGGTVPDQQSGNVGEKITISDNVNSLVNEGFVFDGWNTKADGSGANYTVGKDYTFGNSLSLYAKWKATIVYDGNGSTEGTKPANQEDYINKDITIAEKGNLKRKDGNGQEYDFICWNTESDGSGTNYNENTIYQLRQNKGSMKLYAKWGADITYDGNASTDGTAPTKKSGLVGETVRISDKADLTKTGYEFIGWNTQADGKGTTYNPNEDYKFGDKLYLYAKWGHTITYDGNDATSGTVPEQQKGLDNDIIKISENTGTLVKTGYEFIGWNTQADGKGTTYNPNDNYTFGDKLYLYAKWGHKITYNRNHATSGTVPETQKGLDNDTIKISGNTGTLARTGYEFICWDTQADGGGITYNPNDSHTFGSSLSLYAEWGRSIIYDENDATEGNSPVKQTGIDGETKIIAGKPVDLLNADFVFDGWNTKVDGSGTDHVVGSSYKFGENLLLYAKWKATIQYDANGGTDTIEGAVPVNQEDYINNDITIAEKGSLKRKGANGNYYDFIGWNTKFDGTGTDYSENDNYQLRQNQGSMILHAKWGGKITYDGNGKTGGTVPTEQKGTVGDSKLISGKGDLVKTGYEFLGWNTKANGKGTTYNPNDSYTFGTNLKLYAKWGHTITYDRNNATSGTVPAIQEGLDNEVMQISDNTGVLEKKKHKFVCWNTQADGKGIDYGKGTANTDYTFGTKLELYGKWKKVSSRGSGGETTPNDKKSKEKKWKFDDVHKNDWYHDAVYDVHKKGLMKGTAKRIFSPSIGTTRGMIITTLFRLSRESKIDDDHKFLDVKEGMWYTDAVKWGTKKGIILGYNEEQFGPDDIITREQLVAMIYRYSRYKEYYTEDRMNLTVFNDDKDIYDYARIPFKWTVSTGLIKGVGNDLLAPKRGTTRAELAMLLSRYSNKYDVDVQNLKTTK